jgi:type II secretory pathway pseudopilin PulG
VRALFGIVALLVVATIGGVLAKRQLDATRLAGRGATVAASGAGTGSRPLPAAGAEPSSDRPSAAAQRVGDEVQRALEQGNQRLQQVDR